MVNGSSLENTNPVSGECCDFSVSQGDNTEICISDRDVSLLMHFCTFECVQALVWVLARGLWVSNSCPFPASLRL